MNKRTKIYYPDYSELTDSEADILKNINEDSELVIRFDDDPDAYTTWHDDSELCFNIIINNVKVSFWWIMLEYFAACLYAGESKNALKKFMILIKDNVSSRQQYIEDKEDAKKVQED